MIYQLKKLIGNRYLPDENIEMIQAKLYIEVCEFI